LGSFLYTEIAPCSDKEEFVPPRFTGIYDILFQDEIPVPDTVLTAVM
jgi:hypothetical protein